MFKVLVIAYYFPPMGLSGVQRTLKFVKYMKKYNWEPTVLTTGKTGYFAHDLSLMKECEDAGIRIVRTEGMDPYSLLAKYKTIKMPPEYIRKFLSRVSKTFLIPDNKVFWSKKAYFVAKELLEKEKFDIIFVTIPPFSAFTMASKLSKEFDISLFVDYRDLWTGNQFEFNLTPLHKYLHKKMEYKALKIADKVIAVNRKVKEKLLNTFKFLTFEDVIILPHGFDEEDFTNVTPIPKENTKLRITHAGIFYEYITPRYFLKAFKKLSEERPDVAENIELVFLGHLRKENISLINKLGLQPYVKNLGYLDHKETIKRIISSDVLWMMVGKKANSDSHTPGKLFEYFGTRKPVIACLPEGAAKTAAQEYGAAFITEPDNIEQIKNTLLEVHRLYKAGKLPQPNEDFIHKHRREVFTEQLTKSFQFYLRAI
ncbi:MAG: glycosyltransferase [Ignavibacteriales bacterium]